MESICIFYSDYSNRYCSKENYTNRWSRGVILAMRIIEDNAYYNYKRQIRVSFTIRSISLDCHLIIKQGKSVKAVLSLVSLLVAQLDIILARFNRIEKNRATRDFDRFGRFNSGFLFSRFLQCSRPVLCPFPG